MYTCTCCNKQLPRDSFHKRSDSKRGIRSDCIQCVRDKNNKRYHKSDKVNAAKRSRKHSLRILYNISEENYEEMFHNQGGLCAICKRPESKRKYLCVDHCHETGKVRGLLCHTCNSGLGLFKDDTYLLERSILYLEQFDET